MPTRVFISGSITQLPGADSHASVQLCISNLLPDNIKWFTVPLNQSACVTDTDVACSGRRQLHIFSMDFGRNTMVSCET